MKNKKNNAANDINAIAFRAVMANVALLPTPGLPDVHVGNIPIALCNTESEFRKDRYYRTDIGNKQAEKFKGERCDMITVVPNPEKNCFEVISGVKRILAVANQGGDNPMIRAVIYTCPEDEESPEQFAARRFLDQDKGLDIARPRERHAARVVTGEVLPKKLSEIMAKYGVKFTGRIERGVPCWGAYFQAIKLVEHGQEDCLIWILDVLQDAGWTRVPGAMITAYTKALENVFKSLDNATERLTAKKILVSSLKKLGKDGLKVEALRLRPELDGLKEKFKPAVVSAFFEKLLNKNGLPCVLRTREDYRSKKTVKAEVSKAPKTEKSKVAKAEAPKAKKVETAATPKKPEKTAKKVTETKAAPKQTPVKKEKKTVASETVISFKGFTPEDVREALKSNKMRKLFSVLKNLSQMFPGSSDKELVHMSQGQTDLKTVALWRYGVSKGLI